MSGNRASALARGAVPLPVYSSCAPVRRFRRAWRFHRARCLCFRRRDACFYPIQHGILHKRSSISCWHDNCFFRCMKIILRNVSLQPAGLVWRIPATRLDTLRNCMPKEVERHSSIRSANFTAHDALFALPCLSIDVRFM